MAKSRFMAWLTSTPQTNPATFSEGDGGYRPLSAYITDALKNNDTSSREAALRVPAVLRGRNMICNISTLPLWQLDTKRKRVRSALFEQFDPQVANVVHLAMTVEDLLFDGIAWWEVTARDANNWPTAVRHTDSRRVELTPPKGMLNPLPSGIDPNSVIYVDGKPKDGRNYIRFDSPNPPLLTAGRRAIKRAVALEDAAEMYADDPRALDYFTPADGYTGQSEEEVTANIRAWIAARKQRATGYVPETLKYNTVQSPNPQELQLVGLMERAALDIANAIGVDPEDLGISTTSRTYQNATDRRQDRVNDVLSAYMRAITDRLTMADVTRRGYRAAFVLDDYMRADPKTRWEIHKIANEIGATDIAEIREDEDWPERDDLVPPEPKESPEPAEAAPAEQEESLMNHTVSANFAADTAIDAGQTFRFDDSEAMTFAVEPETRTITGTILLYGVEANNGWGKFTFKKGALTWNKGAVSRVKFLRDHNWENLLGYAAKITATGTEVSASFKVARGAAGDDALTLAEDGALDGLSVGIDIVEWTDDKDGNFTVTKAVLNEVSLTPRPAFDDARLTKVTASKTDTTTKENAMPEETKAPDTNPVTPAPVDVDAAVAAALSKHDEKLNATIATAIASALAKAEKPAEKAPEGDKPAELSKDDEKAATVNPVRPLPTASFEVQEKSPYTFDSKGKFTKGEHDFSTDIVAMLKAGDNDGTKTDFGKRVMAQIATVFEVDSQDVNELNPPINQPGKYYENRAPRTPLWNMVNKGGLPNGLQPFTLPKFSSASGLVQDHTEGVEPAKGTFVTTSQTITPSAVSGKITVTREVWDMGGNPAVSNLIWARMVREYQQGLETATAAFLATLTAATDITLPGGAVGTDQTFAKAVQTALVGLVFADTYDFEAFALEQNLYERLANMVDAEGRPVFPAIGAQNANGTVGNLFQSININGLRGVPAARLPHTPGTLNSSWLFDPNVVLGYATAPQRLEFAGSTSVGSTDQHPYAPVAGIDIAIWGYKAFANTDIGGVRQVTYDTDLAV